MATGDALILQADTAITGAESGCLQSGDLEQCLLRDTGVPFAFVDHGVRNDLRYFYAVTAFDLNSFSSAPSSLESPRTAKPVTPVSPASNYESSAVVKVTLGGRGTDPGHRGGAADPRSCDRPIQRAIAACQRIALGLAELVQEVLDGPGSLSLRLDSLRLGSATSMGRRAR